MDDTEFEKKYARDGTAKPDSQVSKNTRLVRGCQISYFFTKPVDVFTLKTKY